MSYVHFLTFMSRLDHSRADQASYTEIRVTNEAPVLNQDGFLRAQGTARGQAARDLSVHPGVVRTFLLHHMVVTA